VANRVTLDIQRLRAYVDSLDQRGERVAAKVAKDIENNARSRAPVRTGALRNSIHAIPDATGRWRVAVGVPYGYFVEFGTHRQAAQPYLLPAVQEVAKEIAAVTRAEFRP
jgi:HK97 gp10 family phage protein